MSQYRYGIIGRIIVWLCTETLIAIGAEPDRSHW